MNKKQKCGTSLTLGERIRQIITAQNLKQVDFARELGISANYVYLLTSGRKSTVSEPLARLIESTYGYSAHWVLTGLPPEKRRETAGELQEDTIQQVRRMNEQDLRAVAAFIRSLESKRMSASTGE